MVEYTGHVGKYILILSVLSENTILSVVDGGSHLQFFSVYEFKLMEVIKLTLFRNKSYMVTKTLPMQFFLFMVSCHISKFWNILKYFIELELDIHKECSKSIDTGDDLDEMMMMTPMIIVCVSRSFWRMPVICIIEGNPLCENEPDGNQ